MEQFRWEDVRLHNQRENCWIVIESFVYDVTGFLSKHPGGAEIILERAGKDASSAFLKAGHPLYAKEYLKTLLIGEILEPERKTVIRLPPITTSEVLKASASFTAANEDEESQNWQTYVLFAILGFFTLFGIILIVVFLEVQ